MKFVQSKIIREYKNSEPSVENKTNKFKRLDKNEVIKAIVPGFVGKRALKAAIERDEAKRAL